MEPSLCFNSGLLLSAYHRFSKYPLLPVFLSDNSALLPQKNFAWFPSRYNYVCNLSAAHIQFKTESSSIRLQLKWKQWGMIYSNFLFRFPICEIYGPLDWFNPRVLTLCVEQLLWRLAVNTFAKLKPEFWFSRSRVKLKNFYFWLVHGGADSAICLENCCFSISIHTKGSLCTVGELDGLV